MPTFQKPLGLHHDADAGLRHACYDEHHAGNEDDDPAEDLHVGAVACLEAEEGANARKAETHAYALAELAEIQEERDEGVWWQRDERA